VLTIDPSAACACSASCVMVVGETCCASCGETVVPVPTTDASAPPVAAAAAAGPSAVSSWLRTRLLRRIGLTEERAHDLAQRGV